MTTARATVAQQGHRYRLHAGQHAGRDVLAVTAGPSPLVALLFDAGEWPFPSAPFEVLARDLEPMPMVYYHGEVPR